MKLEDLLNELTERMKQIDETWLYYTTRKYKAKRIVGSLDLLKAIIVLHEAKLSITSLLLSALINRDQSSIVASMHMLGDKHIVTLKRKLGNRHYEWLLNPQFEGYLYAKEKGKEEERP